MTQTPPLLEAAWFGRPAPEVAPDLIGCHVVRRLSCGTLLKGMIVETEAYGPGDPACHAYRQRTLRNTPMFGPPGYSYVYLIYGLYHCLNIVTDQKDIPSAVLIRALQLESAPATLLAPNASQWHRVAAGPGKLCQVFQIDRTLSNCRLHPEQGLWLEGRTPEFQQVYQRGEHPCVQTTRIGLTQGDEIPWRWYLQNSAAVSKPIQPIKS